MTLRARTALTVSLVLVIFLALLYFIARYFLLGGFISLERAQISGSVDDLNQALNAEIDNQNRIAGDYGTWDDS
ncbi:MAG TPA: hypothetical protein VMD02_01410, partial [Candidatus Omnitrophota bacterium]|nr:hypothetical protein [Candidatus Omnitrophota bacterium]